MNLNQLTFAILLTLLSINTIASLSTYRGDILNRAYDVSEKGNVKVLVIQGCNCYGFGSGLSDTIRQYCPEADNADQKLETGSGRLGGYSQATILRNDREFIVINGYTQLHGGKVPNKSELYDNIKQVFTDLAKDFPGSNVKFLYPAIGCGIAGGDFSRVQPIINKALEGRDHEYVEYDPEAKSYSELRPSDTNRSKIDQSTSQHEQHRHFSSRDYALATVAVISLAGLYFYNKKTKKNTDSSQELAL